MTLILYQVHNYIVGLGAPQHLLIDLRSSNSFRLRWDPPEVTASCSINSYNISCDDGCPSMIRSTTLTTQTFYSVGITSCNYRCCVQSCGNNVQCSSPRCVSLRESLAHCIIIRKLLLLNIVHSSSSRPSK